MKAATGQGIISSIVLESDDLDEIDWELMGGNTTHVETNYFGKGNTTSYDRAVYYKVEKPQELFHNYTLLWTREKVEWFVDGASIRVLKYAEANAGRTFPQTPMNVRIGIWAGGDKALPKDTVDWAGGLTDYSKGPYSMVVKSARVTDFGGGKEYSYGDKSGRWESIKVVKYVILSRCSHGFLGEEKRLLIAVVLVALRIWPISSTRPRRRHLLSDGPICPPRPKPPSALPSAASAPS